MFGSLLHVLSAIITFYKNIYCTSSRGFYCDFIVNLRIVIVLYVPFSIIGGLNK